ncbi:MAG: glycosyltransferase family 2 protein [Candidatus Micrarchaeota archaeon]|nr:glycosyltransferase family 2 protein [Candidatus Micrarchaeota archaeon]
MKTKISACIMIKNEENNLPGLLRSIDGVIEEIIAIDHESTDRSVEILTRAGATVIKMSDKAKQYSDSTSSFKNSSTTKPKPGEWADNERTILNDHASGEWILHIDADERLNEELRRQLPKLAQQNDYDVIWFFSRHFYAPGKWFKHGFYAPHREPRFYKKSCKINWNVRIHESPQIQGRYLYSDLSYDHLYYTAGEERIKQKHEIYLCVEREQKKEYLYQNPILSWSFIILGYLVYFFYGVFFKLAFLDGWVGITTNHFLSQYFARAGYLEIALKKKFGLIKYNPMLTKD